jgi:methionyl-tRNA formyltransferase
MSALRLAFMGTPDFAVPTLAEIIAQGHEVACVYTQPPRPAGRGKEMRKTPVHEFAEQQGFEVRTPTSLKDEEEQTAFAALDLDVAVVVAYGLILPKPILEAPRLGCLNLHASLLPRWRGAAPIQRAIMAGDKETGVMVMQMEEGLDTGPVLLAERTPIGPRETAGELHDRLAQIGSSLMGRALSALSRGGLDATPQAQDGVTYAHKIEKSEGRIDWSKPAEEVDRIVRGLTPFPGAVFDVGDMRIKVLRAEPVEGSGEPGTVLEGLTVACAAGALKITEVQRAGKAPMSAEAFLRGNNVPAGTRLP